jgi:glucose-6-phosphate 1-epimerase
MLLQADPFAHPTFGSCVTLTALDGSSAVVALHGGHLISWKPDGVTEKLFVSSKATATGAIRGGIPVCFPQFAGLGSLPKHGYARTSTWRHRDAGRFVLDSAPGSWVGFDAACSLLLEVTLGPRSMTVSLSIDNVGPTALTFTGALHTYLAVDDVCKARVDGFGDAHPGTPGVTFGEEIDLSFHGVRQPALVSVDGLPTMLCVQTSFPDGVVWNIGPTAAGNISDLGDGEWQRYVCVEAAVLNPTVVGPGARWTGTQTLVDIGMLA